MSFLKKKRYAVSEEELVADRIRKLMVTFIEEKYQYEMEQMMEMAQVRKLFEEILEKKMQQVRSLGYTVTGFQQMLASAHDEVDKLRLSLYERDQEIVSLRRKMENMEARERVTPRLASVVTAIRPAVSKTLMSETYDAKIDYFDVQTESLRRFDNLAQTLNITRRHSLGLKNYQSTKNTIRAGKENTKPENKKKSKKSAICKSRDTINCRTSLPNRSKKTNTTLEPPPYRDCVKSSIKMLKKLSMAI